jgi:hypothetical protein
MPQQFLDLVVADPVMLLIVEYRNENVDVRQQILQPYFAIELHSEIRTRAPIRKRFVERMAFGDHFITERFKQTAQEVFTTAARQYGDLRLQRNLCFSQLRSAFTPPAERTTEHTRDRHAEK